MKAKAISDIKEVYKCPFFSVSEVELELENGKQYTYYSSTGRNFVVVIVEQYNKLLMVKQFRYPIGKFQMEFPAGGIDDGVFSLQTITKFTSSL